MKIFWAIIVIVCIGIAFFVRDGYDVIFSGRGLGYNARCKADITNINTIVDRKLLEGKIPPSTIPTNMSPITTFLPEFAVIGLQDPWGRVYQIQRIADDSNGLVFSVFSLGPDGIVSRDDIHENQRNQY